MTKSEKYRLITDIHKSDYTRLTNYKLTTTITKVDK